MNYLKDIKIDESALDWEWTRQAELAMKYGQYWLDAGVALSAAEVRLKLLKAQLTELVNSDTDEFLGKGVKPTVGNIESFLLQNEDYQAAEKEVRECTYELGMALIAKTEISNTRKQALENLVKLHGQNYFAGPTMPRNISATVQQKNEEQKANQRIGGKLKRTSKPFNHDS